MENCLHQEKLPTRGDNEVCISCGKVLMQEWIMQLEKETVTK